MERSIYYAIRHLTRFRYSAPVSESVMEARMQPRSEGGQYCLEFSLTTEPFATIFHYRDYHQNIVHHFTIPGRHTSLVITTSALVQMMPMPPLPERVPPQAWQELEARVATDEFWDMLAPSTFARPGEYLYQFMREFGLRRLEDPLTTLRAINTAIYEGFAYAPRSTTVDSSIDEALQARRGVCQDFAHIMLTVGRELGIPCRYVSGYLFHRHEDHDRSQDDATHAWIEAFIPGLDWVGFDPTNNLIARERHIRVAVGRDYADVPPTRGVFKGEAESELDVGVRVVLAPAPIPAEEELLPVIPWHQPENGKEPMEQQQKQQQQ